MYFEMTYAMELLVNSLTLYKYLIVKEPVIAYL